MSVPVTAERKSFLPIRSRANGTTQTSRLKDPMPSASENNNKSSLTVGNRVLVNGLKSGILRYIGTVQFAQGLFCGVELDQAEGKHDGEVKDIRYFQCAPNHGIFVPRDKVVLEPQPRASSSQKPVSRLKPPTMTRSSPLTSAINKTESTKSVQLPDIVPNSTAQPVTLNESIINDTQEVVHSIESVKMDISHVIDIPPLPVDEASETIETDFTDSVSLILRQLQQEERKIDRRSSSITISEEDSDENDDDAMDTESVVESIVDQTHRSSVSSIFISQDSTKCIQTDLSFPIHEQISFNKIQATIPVENKKKSIVQPMKKPTTTIEKRPIAPVANPPKRTITRKPAIVPVKKVMSTKNQLNPTQSITSLPTQSKLSQSLSSCNSLNSSQSDVPSLNKPNKPISDKSQLTNLSSTTSESDQSHIILIKQNQYLQTNNQQLKISYQHLLHQFDLILIVHQYYFHHIEQVKQEHQHQLSKIRIKQQRLQNSIEQLRLSHNNAITSLNDQHQCQIENLRKIHTEELNYSREKFDQLMNEKTELESRCSILQEKVDGFLTEMANSEHADVLLCHVETLEKDRTSLQTVLELKTKELTHLRTRLNEQEIKLTDEQALQKRITMAENRIQDLEWLLREKQLSEKAALVERDELRERTSQIERAFRQLKFENETLRYRLQEQTSSISLPNDQTIESLVSITPSSPPIEFNNRQRSSSVSSTQYFITENDRLTRSMSSFNGLL